MRIVNYNCFFRLESKEKHMNFKIMNISSVPSFHCGKDCSLDVNDGPLSWKLFIQNLFNSVGVTNITVQDDEQVMIFDSGYFENLGQLLNSTPSRC